MPRKSEKLKTLESLIVTAKDFKDVGTVKSSGILPLDLTLKCGGYRDGRLIEWFGPEHSGKTLNALLSAIYDQQRYGKPSLFVDAEGSFDVKWFGKLGGNLDLLDIYDPFRQKEVYGELVYDNTIDLIKTGKYSYVILDSLMGSALLSKKISDKKLDDTEQMGVQARLNSSFFRRATTNCIQTGTNLIITNHISEKMGVVFGNRTTTPGGKALKFYAEVRVELMLPKKDEDNDNAKLIRGKIWKNKRGASAGQKFEFSLDFSKGIDNVKEMRKELRKHDMIGIKEKFENVSWEVFDEYKQKLLDIYDGKVLEGELETSDADPSDYKEGDED